MKKIFIIPELEIIGFDIEDIILTSAGAEDPWGGAGDEEELQDGEGGL